MERRIRLEEENKSTNTKENSNNQPEEVKENKVQEIARDEKEIRVKEKTKRGK